MLPAKNRQASGRHFLNQNMIRTFILSLAVVAGIGSASAQATAADTTYQMTAQDSLNMRQYDMDGVTVTGARKYVKNDIDKLTYDVARDDESKTKSVLEMLRKVPMVTVDGQDNIKVKGESSFKIYKNGHPDPSFDGQNVSQILKSLPASAIKKIEVITDPGAKYDAEGTTYILNIVMKDGSDIHGIAGTVSLAGINKGSAREGVNLTAQAGKFVFSADYNVTQFNARTNGSHSDEETYFKDSGETLCQTADSPVGGYIHQVDLSASYDIDSLNLLSISLGGFCYGGHGDAWQSYHRYAADGSSLYSYNERQHLDRMNYYNFNGRIDYQHKTHLDGEVLTLSYMGSTTRDKGDYAHTFYDMVNMPVAYDGYDQNATERFFEHTWQADYVRPFGSHNKVETGAKYINRSNKSLTDLAYRGDASDDVHSDFKHITHVAAVYAQWMGNYGKWHTRAGLRYEYSYLKAEYPDGSQASFHNDLSDWCPSASVQYDFNDANNLRFNYGTSISRPGISYLNPVRVSTPTTLSYGNPGLNSAKRHSFSLTYTHMGKITFNINPSLSVNNDRIASVRFVEDGRQVSTYGNVVRDRRFWTSYYIQTSPWQGASLSLNGGTGYSRLKTPGAGLALDGWNGYAALDYSQKLPWKIEMNIGGGFDYGRAPMSVYAYSKDAPMWNYISLQRSFLRDDRLTVLLAANAPIHHKFVTRDRTVQGDYTGNSRWERDNFQLGIQVSYRFGRLKASVKHADRSIENTDVVGGMSAKGK